MFSHHPKRKKRENCFPSVLYCTGSNFPSLGPMKDALTILNEVDHLSKWELSTFINAKGVSLKILKRRKLPVSSRGFVRFEVVTDDCSTFINGIDEGGCECSIVRISSDEKIEILDTRPRADKNGQNKAGPFHIFEEFLRSLIPDINFDNNQIALAVIIAMVAASMLKFVLMMRGLIKLLIFAVPIIGYLKSSVPIESSFNSSNEIKFLMTKSSTSSSTEKKKKKKSIFANFVNSAKAGAVTLGSTTEFVLIFSKTFSIASIARVTLVGNGVLYWLGICGYWVFLGREEDEESGSGDYFADAVSSLTKHYKFYKQKKV